MDPNPKSFPVLSFIMARIPYLGSNPPDPDPYDVEQPPPSDPSSSPPSILSQMPHLSDPAVVAAMARAVNEVAQARSVLQTIGPKPDHETVDKAKLRLAEVESNLAKDLEGLVLSPRPDGAERLEWRDNLAEKEKELREAAEKEKSLCNTVLQLHEMHMSYEKMLKEAEERLVAVYEMARKGKAEAEKEEDDSTGVKEEVNEEVVGILSEGPGAALENVDLSNKQLRFLPEAFGKIHSLKVLNLSSNQLAVIPDSISGLVNLEELFLGTNLLVLLPDSIGLLLNLKILNVSGNKLECLPDTICNCSSLVDLDVSFNHLTYLPTNIGIELVNLQRLSIQLNKISHLPTSIGEMRSLQYLDAHFNELQGLPHSIGRLMNLEILNLSNNFSDMTALPETFGDLTNLKELDLSNNQIHALPDTFGRLEKLTKLNLDQNPLVIPPEEIVNEGVEAVKTFMSKRWLDLLVEEERKSMLQVQEQTETGWLTRSTSWLKTAASSVTESVSNVMSPKSPRDPFLDQQL